MGQRVDVSSELVNALREGPDMLSTKRPGSGVKLSILVAIASALSLPAYSADLPKSYISPNGKFVFDWVPFEADNGQVIALDGNSVEKAVRGGAKANIYVVQGREFNFANYKMYFFDCQEHYQVWIERSGLSRPQYMPPKSIMSHIATVACLGAYAPPSDRAPPRR